MKKLKIKLGGDAARDFSEILRSPSKGEPGTRALYIKSTKELYELFSPKKIEMLRLLLSYNGKPQMITEIARKTQRKQEAVSRDAIALEHWNLIEKIRKGRTALLKAKYDTLEISLAQ
ncbi:MAG TPA: hypothetical protein VJH23_04335 [archaeon]|nr:hypothetical protein [archaeon]